jgi:type IV pilus assembly protein PilW
MRPMRWATGFSLLEVTIAVFLSALLMSGITSLLGSSVSAYRQQLGQGQLEESSRFAHEFLVSHISQAGYQPEPWQNPGSLEAVTGESMNGGVQPGDQLGLQRRSAHNCFGNENPVKDAQGQAEFHLLQVHFQVNQANNLAMTCRYGPDVSQLTTQLNNFGLVENVESMQVLYAPDRDGDGVADGWVQAGDWPQENRVLAVRIALLFVSSRAFSRAEENTITLLDETITTPADGRLRSASTLTAAIRGRLK